jgi:26S proteasome regulatory subunit N2
VSLPPPPPFCRGTANNAAVQRLLHFAVSDVSDDVRRAAVLCLGFVLMKAPEQCPKIVGLLAESFNPHVRYGAAMAVGLACAGRLGDGAVGLTVLPSSTFILSFINVPCPPSAQHTVYVALSVKVYL